jgi:TolB protein
MTQTKIVLAALAFTALGALSLTVPASAEELPGESDAQILYSNGGRIIQINADGTGRKVLTHRGRARTPGTFELPAGDRFPRVSPDGSRVLFSRDVGESLPDNEFLFRGKNMLLDLGSGKVREVLPGSRSVSFSNLAWIPGTDRVLAARTVEGRNEVSRSVVSVRLDGSGLRTILRFRDYPYNFPKDDWNFEAARLAASPDGKSFLMTSMDIWSEHGYRLELVDLATGKRKLVSKSAHSGDWSPDGTRFVFVRDRKGLEACDWDFDCTPSGDLFTAAADGTNIRRLTSTNRDEANPAFSPGGSRIVFSGTMHRVTDRTTAELFSMNADGSCAVWLTNGSPASQDPAVIPGAELAAPDNCRATARPALVETHLNQYPVKKDFGRRLWLGPESSQGLLSMDSAYSFIGYTVYGDCPDFRLFSCPPGATLAASSVCIDAGDWASNVAYLVRAEGVKKRRGVWTIQNRSRGEKVTWWTTVFSGRWITRISGAMRPGEGPVSDLGPRAQLRLVQELRPRGSQPGGRLPRLVIPRFDLRLAGNISHQVSRSSVAEVAARYRVKAEEIRQFVSFRGNLRKLGPYGVTNCPDTGFPING